MNYMQLGKSGLEVSKVAIGAFGLGGGQMWSDTHMDEKQAASLFDAALDVGVNFIDTAPVYGLGASEELLGKALAGKRKSFFLQTKCALNWRDSEGRLEYERDGKRVFRNLQASSVRADLEGCLKRLQTDYIDIFITHRQSDVTPVEETMGELLRLRDEGKIRAIGISQASPEILQKYSSLGQVALVQEKMSLLSPDARERYIPLCEQMGVAFQVYSSLEASALTGPQALGREFPAGDYRGKHIWFAKDMRPYMDEMYAGLKPLCEKYNCSYANLVQAWTLHLSPCMNLLTGIRHIETLRDTVKALEIELAEADIQKMQKDSEIVRAMAKKMAP